MAGQVDRVAGIQHDRDAMRAEQEKKNKKKCLPTVKVRRCMPICVKTSFPAGTMSMICFQAWAF